MERRFPHPEPVVIGQDDQSEVHVQPVLQGTRRSLDIRVWRRGSGGVTPSRAGVTLEATDLAALNSGIVELLDVSDGGTAVARVVWDSEDGRRLRAETEPFGTQFVAKFGFWQRVRDTWKPVDDGFAIPATHLLALQRVLKRMQPWLAGSEEQEPAAALTPHADVFTQWPPPGADWLTVETDRVALHPRGIRLTCTISDQDNIHRVVVRQWRRDDTLWLPEATSITLSTSDLDGFLSALARLAEMQRHGRPADPVLFDCMDQTTLRLSIEGHGPTANLVVEQATSQRSGAAGPFEPRLSLPAVHLLRLGRALAQSWLILIGWLTEAEREELDQVQARMPSSATKPEVEPGALPPPPRESMPLAEDDPARRDLRQPTVVPGQVFSFGAESETPGTVVLNGSQIRLAIEGFMFPRSVGLPGEVVSQVILGLHKLNELRQQHSRVDPVLLCDRPDCAVYGRVGTTMRPDAVEIRVWTSPTTSESISFEGVYLPDMIDALHGAAKALGNQSASTPIEEDIPAMPPAPLPQPSAPARVRPVAPGVPLEGPGRKGGMDTRAMQLAIPLGGVTLGESHIAMSIQGNQESPVLRLQWAGNTLDLAVHHLEDLLADLRALYYDALRGRRGRSLSVGQYPIVTIGVHNAGTELHCTLEQDIDGERTALSFPANEVLTFLNAARTALTRTEKESD